MQGEEVKELNDQFDECINKVNQLTSHLKMLSKQHKMENLEELLLADQYLSLLANSLYAVNSTAYSYSSLKNVPFPQQFSKVQQYFKKAKNPLTAQAGQPQVVVDKEAAKRIISSGIK